MRKSRQRICQEQRKDAGLCPKCGQKPNPGYVCCERCCRKMRLAKRKVKEFSCAR